MLHKVEIFSENDTNPECKINPEDCENAILITTYNDMACGIEKYSKR